MVIVTGMAKLIIGVPSHVKDWIPLLYVKIFRHSCRFIGVDSMIKWACKIYDIQHTYNLLNTNSCTIQFVHTVPWQWVLLSLLYPWGHVDAKSSTIAWCFSVSEWQKSGEFQLLKHLTYLVDSLFQNRTIKHQSNKNKVKQSYIKIILVDGKKGLWGI